MSVVIDAIRENLRKIKIIFEPTESSFLKDTKQTGYAREVTVKEFLECFFPSSYRVKKGLIYSFDSFSQEMDCVLLAPNHPRLVTPVREVIIAEGVHVAIEIKPDITTLSDKSEFQRGLKQIKTVKNLNREISFLPTNDFPPNHKIPCVIFSNKSKAYVEIVNYMSNLVKTSEFQPDEFPDLIVSLDNGILYHSHYASKSMFRNFIGKQKPNHSERIFLHIPHSENTLATFLFLLYNITPPEPHLTDSILKKYLALETEPITLYEY